MTKRFSQLLILLTFLSVSCIVDSDLPFPKGESQFVLNGILNPDSIIKVNLTKTRSLALQTPFEVVENAFIKLYEDGTLIDTLAYKSSGDYFSDLKPLEGGHYKIEVSGPDIENSIEGEDTVPARPEYAACFRQTKDPAFTSEYDVTVDIQFLKLNVAQFQPWIEFISNDYKYDFNGNDTSKLLNEKFFIINTNSPHLDDFNGAFDNFSGYYDYHFYLRISDSFANTKDLSVDVFGGRTTQSSRLFRYEVITNLIKDQSLILNVINCSPNYDKYLKSTLQDFLNSEFVGVSTLFSGPVKIHSNIKNGVGIFGSYSTRAVQVNKFECE